MKKFVKYLNEGLSVSAPRVGGAFLPLNSTSKLGSSSDTKSLPRLSGSERYFLMTVSK